MLLEPACGHRGRAAAVFRFGRRVCGRRSASSPFGHHGGAACRVQSRMSMMMPLSSPGRTCSGPGRVSYVLWSGERRSRCAPVVGRGLRRWPETHLVLAESHVGGAVSGTPTVCSRLSGLVREVGCFGGFRSASLMSVRNGRDQRSRALEWSAVISLAFCGLVEWSAVGPAERSLRSEGGRTADTAGMGGRGYRK